MRLRLIDLTKRFYSLRRSTVALSGVNLEIRDKEFFVLLGPSGCGKTTLLNLIAGLERPTGGEVWFEERLVVSNDKKLFLPPKERNVAFVFQSYALYPHLNAFENIAFPLRVTGKKSGAIKKAVEDAADRLEISRILSARPGELSGGQRQRVAIARAIVRRPSVFLLDEPLSNLDAQLRSSTRAELKRLQRSLGITTIYVTHDQVEAMTLGDRVAILKEGRLEQIGTPDELYERPVNTFVATFIGSPSMNLIETTFLEESGAYYVMIGGNKFKMPPEKAWDLKKLKSKSCIFGIRPEHIFVNSYLSELTFGVKVDSIEPLGKEILLHILINGHKFLALTGNRAFREGQTVQLGFDLRRAHIF